MNIGDEAIPVTCVMCDGMFVMTVIQYSIWELPSDTKWVIGLKLHFGSSSITVRNVKTSKLRRSEQLVGRNIRKKFLILRLTTQGMET